MSVLSGVKYKVLFTPKVSINSYGTEVDVSDRIRVDGLQKIKRSIDSGDYGFGVYTYDDIDLKGFNRNGIFNGPEDSRSMFPAGRDGCIVKVVFTQYDNQDNDTDTIVFNGLINEEATRLDVVKDIITLRVLSLDSIIRNTKVPAGIITTNVTVKDALLQILSSNRIEQILNVDEANINPALNLEIDVGTVFDDKPAKEAIDDLLLVSNSVMIIDSSLNVIVRPRTEKTDRPILKLYGKSELYGRENVINLSDYNSGFHRVFTSIVVNDVEKSNAGLSSDYGVRQKAFTFDFITDAEKESQIAQTLLDEFKAAKTELVVKVPIRTILTYDLLDRVSIDYPLRVKPVAGKFLPVVGVSSLGETITPLPLQFGSLAIDPRIAFKIIEIAEDPKSFSADIKLRQIGVDVFDGQFNTPGSFILGFAVLGDALLQPTEDECATWNPSVLGAAQMGCTEVA